MNLKSSVSIISTEIMEWVRLASGFSESLQLWSTQKKALPAEASKLTGRISKCTGRFLPAISSVPQLLASLLKQGNARFN